jgi:hypothetical protein
MKNKNSKYFYPRSFLYSLALFPCGYGRAQLLTVRWMAEYSMFLSPKLSADKRTESTEARRTKVKFCTCVDTKPFSPPIAKPLNIVLQKAPSLN